MCAKDKLLYDIRTALCSIVGYAAFGALGKAFVDILIVVSQVGKTLSRQSVTL